jgi:1,4-alpha-glucan branching enzyme
LLASQVRGAHFTCALKAQSFGAQPTQLSRIAAGVSRQRNVSVAAGEMSPLEVLRRENELLKATVAEASASIQELETSLSSSNVPLPQGGLASSAAALDTRALEPQDYWSPTIDVPAGYVYEDEYGAITPVPSHDGTECLKWDDTLWSHADHFRVGAASRVWQYQQRCCCL